jgi:hypothetical protein
MKGQTVKRKGGRKWPFRRGDRAWFEYHCWESDESADAKVWHHSHQRVKVLKLTERGYGATEGDRCNNGLPALFKVQFEDGFIEDVFEDELLKSKRSFCRPDPPK